ncbi:MAG: hypothetical protein LBJ32_01810 [Oscillospiraceae bacterium]|jgi:hypothetical protein|nr:hypothetical protein [Oscillospiraceae bacterium]
MTTEPLPTNAANNSDSESNSTYSESSNTKNTDSESANLEDSNTKNTDSESADSEGSDSKNTDSKSTDSEGSDSKNNDSENANIRAVGAVAEGEDLRKVNISTLTGIELLKYGRLFLSPYETMKNQNISVFNIFLRRVGRDIADEVIQNAVAVLGTNTESINLSSITQGNLNKDGKLFMLIFKFNFAGSGDFVWRKVTDPKKEITRNQEDLFQIEKPNDENPIKTVSHGVDIGKVYGKMININEKVNLTEIIEKINDKEINVYKFTPKKEFSGEKIPRIFVWCKTKTKRNADDANKMDTITTYTMPGSDSYLGKRHFTKGFADTDDFSIRNNVENFFPFIEKTIKDFFKNCENSEDKIFVKIKGHSRGGVAANIITNLIVKSFGKEIKSERLEICSVTFDPVPGGGLHAIYSDRNKSKLEIKDEYDDLEMLQNINNAVVYSIDSGYLAGFTPQKIFNSKVVIISIKDHAAGLYDRAYNAKDGKWRKQPYILGGKEFRPGELYKLKEGVYWSNEKQILERIERNNYNNYIKELFDHKGKELNKDRKKFLINLIFERTIEKKKLMIVLKIF